MNKDHNIAIIIPCYNEGSMLELGVFRAFLAKHVNVSLCFVNDGSTDNTLSVLNGLKSERVNIINLEKNQGKAEAVRAGINTILKEDKYNYIAYLDADLSTPLSEIFYLVEALEADPNLEMVFGSRILKVGSKIDRKWSRFLIGRVIATFISRALKLKVYDTQCGAKVFNSELAQEVFKEPFISSWLFDVEIMFRVLKLFGRSDGELKMKEIPLNIWEEKGNSKLKWTYGFKVFFDLYKIKKQYKNV